MIITMGVAMGMMQVAPHPKILVVLVRHLQMAATIPMLMSVIMPIAIMLRRTLRRVLFILFHHMVVHMIAVRMMKMPLMDVIHMSRMLHLRVVAVRAMFVLVLAVRRAGSH